jgi:hypothetical protein
MEQHREAQAHNTMFSCDVCPSKFGSKQAMANHRKSPGHKRMVDRAELAARSSVGVISCVGNVRFLFRVKCRGERCEFRFLHTL